MRTNEVSARLVEFIKSTGKTVAGFEHELGLSNGFVSKTNGRMQRVTQRTIQAAYPQLNMDWVLTGEGEMINPHYKPSDGVGDDDNFQPLAPNAVSGNGNNINYGKDNVISHDQRLIEIIQKQQDTIAEQSKQLGEYVKIISNLTKNLQLCHE